MSLLRFLRWKSIICVSQEDFSLSMKTKYRELTREKANCLIVTYNPHKLYKLENIVTTAVDPFELLPIIVKRELDDISRVHVVHLGGLNIAGLRESAMNLPNVVFTSEEQLAGFHRYTAQISISAQEYFQTYNYSGIEFIQFDEDVDYLDFGLIELFDGLKRITLHDFELQLPSIVELKDIEEVCIMGDIFYELPHLINFRFIKTLHLQNLPKDMDITQMYIFQEFFKDLHNLSELSLAGPLQSYYENILTWIPSKFIKSFKLDCNIIDDLTIHSLAKHESLELVVLPTIGNVEYVRNYLNSLMKEGKFRNLSHVCLQTNFYIVKKSKLHRSKKELS